MRWGKSNHTAGGKPCSDLLNGHSLNSRERRLGALCLNGLSGNSNRQSSLITGKAGGHHDLIKQSISGFVDRKNLRSVYKELHADRETGC